MLIAMVLAIKIDNVNGTFQFDCDIFTNSDLRKVSFFARSVVDIMGNTTITITIKTTIGQIEK
jgi:hypothetical protein